MSSSGGVVRAVVPDVLRVRPEKRELPSDSVDPPEIWRVCSSSGGGRLDGVARDAGSGCGASAWLRSVPFVDSDTGEWRRGLLVGGCLGVSPGSGGRGGPWRNVATAWEAPSNCPRPDFAPISSALGDGERSSRLRFPVERASVALGADSALGAEDAPTSRSPCARALPLLPGAGMSLNGTQSRLSWSSTETGGSISMSLIMLMSMTTSPATDQPAIPYPPARTEGERPCLRQNLMTALTSWASSGETRTRQEGFSCPLKVLARSGYLEG